jgi:peptidylprolyl isomerase
VSKTVLIIIALVVVGYFVWTSMSNKKAAALNIEAGLVFLAENGKKDGVNSTESGLQYKVLSVGSGIVNPRASDKVKVHYHGTLADGTVFDSSVDRGEPLSFGLNQVIKGWTEGVQLMVVGEKTQFYIPSSLAYGNRSTGSIPPGAMLIFDVELLAIN